MVIIRVGVSTVFLYFSYCCLSPRRLTLKIDSINQIDIINSTDRLLSSQKIFQLENRGGLITSHNFTKLSWHNSFPGSRRQHPVVWEMCELSGYTSNSGLPNMTKSLKELWSFFLYESSRSCSIYAKSAYVGFFHTHKKIV